MKRLIPLLFLLLFSTDSYTQNIDWAKTMNFDSSLNHVSRKAVSSRISHNQFLTGFYYKTTQVSGSVFQTGPSVGFVVKLTSAGDTIWSWRSICNFQAIGNAMGTPIYSGGLFPTSIAVDQNDNTVIVGEYNLSGTTSAAPGTIQIGSTTISMNNTTNYGAFIVKIDSSGNVLWVYHNHYLSVHTDVDIDRYNNIYVIGGTRLQSVFGNDTVPAPPSGPYNSRDFILKLNSSGNFLWAKGLGHFDQGTAFLSEDAAQRFIRVSKSSPLRLVTAGAMQSSYSFPGASFSGAGNTDALVLKFDSAGNYLGGRTEGGVNNEEFSGVDFDKDSGIALVGMYKTSTVLNGSSFSAGTYYCGMFVMKLHPSLGLNWMDTLLHPTGCMAVPNVATSMADYIAVTCNVMSTGVSVPYVYVYNASGSRQFKKNCVIGTGVSFPGAGVSAPSFSRLSPGKLYVPISFRPSLALDTFNLAAPGSYRSNMALIKLDVPLPCTPNLGPDTGYCGNFSRTLYANVSQASYLWSNQDTNAFITVTQPGTYWVKVSKPGCVAQDTIVIVRDNSLASFTPLPDTTLCNNLPLTLSVPPHNARSFKWWNNTSASSVQAPMQIVHPWIVYQNYCGSVRDSMKISRLSKATVYLGRDTTLCTYQQITLQAGPPGLKYTWSTGDTLQTLSVSGQGQFWVDVSNYCGVSRDSILISTLPNPTVQLGADTFICGNAQVTLSGTSTHASSYLWNNNASSPLIFISQPGMYTLQAINRCGTARDSIRVSKFVIPNVSISGNNYVCSGQQTTLTAQSNEKVIWSTQDTSSAITVNQPGKYWVSSSNLCGQAADTAVLALRHKSTPNLGRDTTVCTSFVNVSLYAGTQADYYKWSNGQEGSNLAGIAALAQGWYWLDASNVCGTVRDSVLISKSSLPKVNLGNDTIVRSVFSITLDAGADGKKYRWSRSLSDTGRFINVTMPGTYWVDVSNICGTKRDSIVISIVTGINPVHNHDVSIYPVPASKNINIHSRNAMQKIQLLNAQGTLVYENKKPDATGVSQIESSDLANGVYLLNIYYPEGILTRKVIIAHP